ncbi:MAG: hypothetical protein WAS21_06370 [Geminicoccaceae bacterium]
MQDDNDVIFVSNEEEAFDALSSALSRYEAGASAQDIRFHGWPHINIKLPNTEKKSSITPSMMQAFIELQESIYRSQKIIEEQTIDLRSLSEHERKLLEFDVVVSDGSSLYDIDMTEIISRLGGEVVAKMSPELIALCIIAIPLIFAGASVWRAHIQSKVDKRKEEITSEDRRAFLSHMSFMGEQETRRMGLLMRAKEVAPVLKDVDELADEGRQALIKGIAGNGGGELQGIELDADVANELTKTARQSSREEEIEGVFDVTLVDPTFKDGFRVRLEDIGTGEEFFAALFDRLVAEDHYRVIQAGEWGKTPVRLKLRVRRLRGKIVDAIVLDAKPAAAPVP